MFPDPNKFNPSRWLLPEEDYKALSKHLWTYSSGPQSCIGRDFSLASRLLHSPFGISVMKKRLILLITVMKTTLVKIYTRFKTIEDASTQDSHQMAKIQFARLPAHNRIESIEDGLQRLSATTLIPPEKPSQCQCRSAFEGARRCSSHLNSLPRSSELRRSSPARTELEDTNTEPGPEADVKFQSCHPLAQGGFSVSLGQLQASVDTPPRHLHKDLFAERYPAGDNAWHTHKYARVRQRPLAPI